MIDIVYHGWPDVKGTRYQRGPTVTEPSTVSTGCADSGVGPSRAKERLSKWLPTETQPRRRQRRVRLDRASLYTRFARSERVSDPARALRFRGNECRRGFAKRLAGDARRRSCASATASHRLSADGDAGHPGAESSAAAPAGPDDLSARRGAFPGVRGEPRVWVAAQRVLWAGWRHASSTRRPRSDWPRSWPGSTITDASPRSATGSWTATTVPRCWLSSPEASPAPAPSGRL